MKVLPSGTLSETLDSDNFAKAYWSSKRAVCQSILIAETCYQPSFKKIDTHSVMNWTVISQLIWQQPICDDRPLVYHSDRQALSTARFRRAGPLATADTCLDQWSPSRIQAADLLELVLQQLDLFHQLTGLCHVLGLQRITVLRQCAQVCRQRANDIVTLQQCLLEFPQLEHIWTKDIFIF